VVLWSAGGAAEAFNRHSGCCSKRLQEVSSRRAISISTTIAPRSPSSLSLSCLHSIGQFLNCFHWRKIHSVSIRRHSDERIKFVIKSAGQPEVRNFPSFHSRGAHSRAWVRDGLHSAVCHQSCSPRRIFDYSLPPSVWAGSMSSSGEAGGRRESLKSTEQDKLVPRAQWAGRVAALLAKQNKWPLKVASCLAHCTLCSLQAALDTRRPQITFHRRLVSLPLSPQPNTMVAHSARPIIVARARHSRSNGHNLIRSPAPDKGKLRRSCQQARLAGIRGRRTGSNRPIGSLSRPTRRASPSQARPG